MAQAILDSLKSHVEQHCNKSFSKFQALSYKTQVVAGLNYLFKVQVDDSIIHIKIHKPLPHTQKEPVLMEVTTE